MNQGSTYLLFHSIATLDIYVWDRPCIQYHAMDSDVGGSP